MCGIVGAAGKIGFDEEKMVKRLLQLDTVRGPHSTGLFGATTGGQCNTFKKAGTPWEMVEYKGWDEFWRNNHNVIIGHNRWATQGAINHRNAHPFTFDTLHGVHNGTLRNQYLLDDAKDFEVDSENIYYHMARNGVADTVANLNGAYALVWYDSMDNTLNMVRNAERPMFFAYTEDDKTIFWASEAWMLTVSAKHAGIVLGQITELRKDIHMSLHVKPQNIHKREAIKPDDIRIRGMVPFEMPIVQNNTRKYLPAKKHTASQSNVVKLEDKGLAQYRNKMIQFRVIEKEEVCSSGLAYLDCFMEGKPEVEVRCYIHSGAAAKFDMMVEHDHTYSGKVSTLFQGKSNSYLVLDPRSIYVTELEDSGNVKK